MHQLARMRELEAIAKALRITAIAGPEGTVVTLVALREVVGVAFPWALGLSAYEGCADDTPAPRSTWDTVSLEGVGRPVLVEIRETDREASLRVELRWGTAFETVSVDGGAEAASR